MSIEQYYRQDALLHYHSTAGDAVVEPVRSSPRGLLVAVIVVAATVVAGAGLLANMPIKETLDIRCEPGAFTLLTDHQWAAVRRTSGAKAELVVELGSRSAGKVDPDEASLRELKGFCDSKSSSGTFQVTAIIVPVHGEGR